LKRKTKPRGRKNLRLRTKELPYTSEIEEAKLELMNFLTMRNKRKLISFFSSQSNNFNNMKELEIKSHY